MRATIMRLMCELAWQDSRYKRKVMGQGYVNVIYYCHKNIKIYIVEVERANKCKVHEK